MINKVLDKMIKSKHDSEWFEVRNGNSIYMSEVGSKRKFQEKHFVTI